MAGFGNPKIQHGFYPVWESNLADTLHVCWVKPPRDWHIKKCLNNLKIGNLRYQQEKNWLALRRFVQTFTFYCLV